MTFFEVDDRFAFEPLRDLKRWSGLADVERLTGRKIGRHEQADPDRSGLQHLCGSIQL
jgi:hypothetical protein